MFLGTIDALLCGQDPDLTVARMTKVRIGKKKSTLKFALGSAKSLETIRSLLYYFLWKS